MALTSEVLVSESVETPDGYTKPTAAITLSDPSSESRLITLAASGIANATPSTGMGTLVTSVKTEIDGTTLPAFGVDSVGNNIDAQYTIMKVVRDHGDHILSDTDNYLVNVRIEWEVV